ncbi:uncharacterized protein A1O9_05644 [Exophiala aquamarina CBS 119918]|uniref:Haloacid dehalogenase, type II n=1 Tax=Exophiala aquamarina CBS 119918 TaxID=1182545 RepID=A0A072PQE6_9EURO|nr:uncharacterized protein A1O9_05644 [Exophiala aquamarina CBS 119918]KEF57725.1 hypothetical protein A1O9_05644 [Exophiala aquamarina CBS 119918]
MSSSSIISEPPRVLFIDVFGTVVNWRLTVTQTLQKRASEVLQSSTAQLSPTLRKRASTTDWAAFTQKWREAYYHFCVTYDPAKVNGSPGGYKTIDQHHRESLSDNLETFNLTGLWSKEELDELAMVWHYLAPWPDSPRGLELLTQKFITSSLSNGNVSLLQDLATTGNLLFTHILSSEMFKAYKPNPLVYNGAAQRLGVPANQCALVAAHLADLEGARQCQFRTIYIDRENEEGWSAEDKEKARDWVDLWVDGCLQNEEDGFVELARLLGIMIHQSER